MGHYHFGYFFNPLRLGVELVSSFTLQDSGRLTSYDYNNGDNHATLVDDLATADGYLIIDTVTEIGKTYLISVKPSVVSIPTQSYYKNRVVITAEQIPLSNQGTVKIQDLTFVAKETVTPLYLYTNDLEITYSNISMKEVL